MNPQNDILKDPGSNTILDYRMRINMAMRFVNENWGEELNIQRIAQAARYSPFHFHRIFNDLVGETVTDHIRKERTRQSAALLLSGIPVTEVAMATGFWTASAFSKSFKQVTGLTPTQFQQLCKDKQLIFPTTSAFQKVNKSIEIKPRLIEESAFDMYYISKEVSNEGLLHENLGKAAYEAFDQWLSIIKALNLESVISKRLGVIRGIDSVYPGYYVYDAGIVFKQKVQLEGLKDVQCAKVTKGKWAVFLHKGPYNTLWQTWNWIYNYWRRASGYRIRREDPYEVYLNNQRNTPQNDLLTDVYIPIY